MIEQVFRFKVLPPADVPGSGTQGITYVHFPCLLPSWGQVFHLLQKVEKSYLQVLSRSGWRGTIFCHTEPSLYNIHQVTF